MAATATLSIDVEMENPNTLCTAFHLVWARARSLSISIHPSIHVHSYRAIFRRQSSVSSNDTIIPLDRVGEGVWWLKFIGKDWENVKTKSLQTTLPLCVLLAALGTQTNDIDDAAFTLCLAPGPGQLFFFFRSSMRLVVIAALPTQRSRLCLSAIHRL